MKASRVTLLASMLQVLPLAGAIAAQTDWRTPPLPLARSNHAMCYDSVRNRMVVFGGEPLQGDTCLWDGTNWTLVKPAISPPATLTGASLVFDIARGRAVLFGGGSDATWEWDGAAWTQANPATRPALRFNSCAWYDPARARVMMFGGAWGSVFFSDTWEYDGTNWRQLTTPLAPSARAFSAVAYDSSRGKAVLFGGSSSTNVFSDTWVWNGTTWTQALPNPIPPARSGHSMAFDPQRGRTVMVAGQLANLIPDAWEWDGSTWVRVQDPPSQLGSYEGTLAFVPPLARCVYFGGSASLFRVSASLWGWDGSRWRSEVPLQPVPWLNSRLAWSAANQATLLFGGDALGLGESDETWLWDGERWLQPTPAARPSARTNPNFCADPGRGRVVLFGGESAGTALGDTWEWDGVTWTQLQPTHAPSARRHAAMAFDAARGRVVLFGGREGPSSAPTLVGDQWEWDGTDWTQVSPAHAPSPRAGSAMDFDLARGRMVLFGGATATGNTNDTWEWDGADWTSPSPAVRPPARCYHGLCYDAARKRIMVVAGFIFLSDTWQWDGVQWVQVSTPTLGPTQPYMALAYDVARGTPVAWGRGLREFRTAKPPRVAGFGTGCRSVLTDPVLEAQPGSYPLRGALLTLSTSGLRPSWPAFFALGASRDQALGRALPFDLGIVGMPGCTLLQSCDVTPYALAGAGGVANLDLRVPDDASLVGTAFYAQSFTVDALANPLGWLATRALELRIGE